MPDETIVDDVTQEYPNWNEWEGSKNNYCMPNNLEGGLACRFTKHFWTLNTVRTFDSNMIKLRVTGGERTQLIIYGRVGSIYYTFGCRKRGSSTVITFHASSARHCPFNEICNKVIDQLIHRSCWTDL